MFFSPKDFATEPRVIAVERRGASRVSNHGSPVPEVKLETADATALSV